MIELANGGLEQLGTARILDNADNARTRRRRGGYANALSKGVIVRPRRAGQRFVHDCQMANRCVLCREAAPAQNAKACRREELGRHGLGSWCAVTEVRQ